MKINFKKGATIADEAMIMIILIFGFVAITGFAFSNATANNIVINDKYNKTQEDLIHNQQRLGNLTQTLKNLVGDVQEAPGDNPGYFGLKGVLSLMVSPLAILDISVQTFLIFIGFNEFLPPWIKDTITIAITIIVIFSIIAFITQRGKDQT